MKTVRLVGGDMDGAEIQVADDVNRIVARDFEPPAPAEWPRDKPWTFDRCWEVVYEAVEPGGLTWVMRIPQP